VGEYERVATNIKSLRSLEGLECGRDIFCSPDFQCGGLKPELASQCMNLAHLQQGAGTTDIGHDRKPTKTGDNLAQKFEALADKIGSLNRQAGHIAARPAKTANEAAADRVRRRREHDRDDPCRLLKRDDGFCSGRDNDIGLESNELGRHLGEAFGVSFGPTILDCDGATLDPTEFAQPLHKQNRHSTSLSCVARLMEVLAAGFIGGDARIAHPPDAGDRVGDAPGPRTEAAELADDAERATGFAAWSVQPRAWYFDLDATEGAHQRP
jgi:hypothetical protein